MGRPSIFSEELAERVLDELAAGKSLVKICLADDMPTARTIYRWTAENAEFCHSYAHAREVQAEFMDDLVMDVAAKAGEDPQGARVKIDAYKWRASHLAPKKYGTKLDLTTQGGKLNRELNEVDLATRMAAWATDVNKSRDAAD